MAISIGRLPDSEAQGRVEAPPANTRSEAFDCFYRAYVPRVAGYVRRHIHDPELIDDIVQETLMRAYRHGLHHETGDEHWRWLSTVARNLCIDQRALHRNWRECRFEKESQIDLRAPAEVDPEAYAVFAESRDRLLRALAGLSERERRLLVQKHVEGRGVREIARLEGVHVEALKSALRRARRAFADNYATLADRRHLSAVVGSVTAAAAARWRALKGRLATMADHVGSLAGHVGTSAGLSTASLAIVVGATVLTGSQMDGEKVASASRRTEPAAVGSVRASVSLPEAPVTTEDPQTEPAESLPAPRVAAAPPPSPPPPPPSPPPSSGPSSAPVAVRAEVTTDDDVPVGDAPAGGGGKTSVDKEGVGVILKGSLDADGDGDREDEGVVVVSVSGCGPPESWGTVRAVACPVVVGSGAPV